MPLLCKSFSFRRQHAVLNLGHLELEFPVGCIFPGVWLTGKNVYI